MAAAIDLSGFMRGFDAFERDLNTATRTAVSKGGAVVEANIKRKATGPARWSGKPRVNHPREGGPGVVTGNLRRSVRIATVRQIGPGVWECTGGPSAVYARAIELGHPRWHRTAGYPFVVPGLAESVPELRVVYVAAWRAVLTKRR